MPHYSKGKLSVLQSQLVDDGSSCVGELIEVEAGICRSCGPLALDGGQQHAMQASFMADFVRASTCSPMTGLPEGK
jgi:hypothetical protein